MEKEEVRCDISETKEKNTTFQDTGEQIGVCSSDIGVEVAKVVLQLGQRPANDTCANACHNGAKHFHGFFEVRLPIFFATVLQKQREREKGADKQSDKLTKRSSNTGRKKRKGIRKPHFDVWKSVNAFLTTLWVPSREVSGGFRRGGWPKETCAATSLTKLLTAPSILMVLLGVYLFWYLRLPSFFL